MSKEKQIEERLELSDIIDYAIRDWDDYVEECHEEGNSPIDTFEECIADAVIGAGYRKQEWISVDDRLPTEDEYLTHHNDGLDTLKRLLIAYQTDTIEYQIGCYDGWKWMNQFGNRVVKGVVAWKPFEAYELPKMKGGAE